MFFLHALLVFAGVTFVDTLWALYIRYTANGSPWRASISAVGLTLCGALLTLEYVKDPLMLIPAGLGAFVGTFATLKWGKHAPTSK